MPSRERPIIGITPSYQESDNATGLWRRWNISTNYVDAIAAAGGIPIILPPHAGAAFGDLLDVVDGLVLSGGGDISPHRYGATSVHAQTYGVNGARDELELGILTAALERDLPILCICRGIQILNVALGGDLTQHLGEAAPDALQHRQHQAGHEMDEVSHTVTGPSGSLLAQVYGTSTIMANSYHHQAINHLGTGLVITGTTEDTVIESVEAPAYRFVLGVQWHPEMLFRRHTEHLRPFTAVVTAASRSLVPSG